MKKNIIIISYFVFLNKRIYIITSIKNICIILSLKKKKNQYYIITDYVLKLKLNHILILTIDPIAGDSKNIIKAKKLKTRPASEIDISFFSA